MFFTLHQSLPKIGKSSSLDFWSWCFDLNQDLSHIQVYWTMGGPVDECGAGQGILEWLYSAPCKPRSLLGLISLTF